MATDAQSQSPLSGQVPLYANPEPLDAARHGRLGMNRSDKPFRFAAGQHFVPLHVTEFPVAALCYPIIFAGEQRTPLAVMGLAPGHNLYIDAEGGFRNGAYLPAFIRRYPFVGARDADPSRLLVCIDRSFELFTENNPDVPLFENGQPTAFTQGCIEICGQFDALTRTTEDFVKLLGDNDLFETRQTNHTPRLVDGSAGPPQQIAEYYAVSEEKLKSLSPGKLAHLRDNGALGQIYAHLLSLLGWDRLIIETLERNAGQQPLNG